MHWFCYGRCKKSSRRRKKTADLYYMSWRLTDCKTQFLLSLSVPGLATIRNINIVLVTTAFLKVNTITPPKKWLGSRRCTHLWSIIIDHERNWYNFDKNRSINSLMYFRFQNETWSGFFGSVKIIMPHCVCYILLRSFGEKLHFVPDIYSCVS